MIEAISRPVCSASSSPAKVIGVSQGRAAADYGSQASCVAKRDMSLHTLSPRPIGIVCACAVPNQY